jgi:hypothetical protein
VSASFRRRRHLAHSSYDNAATRRKHVSVTHAVKAIDPLTRPGRSGDPRAGVRRSISQKAFATC